MKKILVAIDGSEKSIEALDKAVEIGKKMGSKIELLHVVEPIKLPYVMHPYAMNPGANADPASPGWVSDYYESYRKENKKMLQKIYDNTKKKHPELSLSQKLVEGLPATEIVNRAKEEGFDLITVGARGLGFVEELLLGSTSDLVVDKSPIPVLVVK
jgi:nucleotide-binding universal stress UspA family protein